MKSFLYADDFLYIWFLFLFLFMSELSYFVACEFYFLLVLLAMSYISELLAVGILCIPASIYSWDLYGKATIMKR